MTSRVLASSSRLLPATSARAASVFASSSRTAGSPWPRRSSSALSDQASTAEATDWTQILALYDMLRYPLDNPVVAFNHAVAAAMVRGPEAGFTRRHRHDSRDHRPLPHHGDRPRSRAHWSRDRQPAAGAWPARPRTAVVG